MKLSIKAAAAGVSTLALATSLVVAGGGVASAATPPFDLCDNGATQGTISFYDTNGTKITSGNADTPPAYAMADTDTGRPGDTLATVYAATPVEGANPLSWPNDQLSVSAAYPTSALSVPENLRDLPTALASNLFNWEGYRSDFPNTSANASWQDLYQIRVVTSGPGQAVDPSRFASATIQVSGGTWTQVYPTPGPASTATTLTTSPESPQDAGTSISLNAVVAPDCAAGSVEFFDGGVSLGTEVVSGGSATLSGVNLTPGVHSLSATFTPTDALRYASSTSADVPFEIRQAPTVDSQATVTGTTRVGYTVSCDASFTGATSMSYKWLRRGNEISGATTQTYQLRGADYDKTVKCRATATNVTGSTSSTSAGVTIGLGDPLVVTTNPTITGTPKVGRVLAADPGVWTPAATSYSYQWYRGRNAILGATSKRYTAVSADAGKRVSCRVTALKTGYANGVKKTASVVVTN